ncbi:flavin reductase family protein [Rhodoplanes sp. SY1]|uniref:flavin reductase family protein n=1 Tax=Rhodoplanes sp. SY1 TaxID=3166646 RepID=UPI0038B6922B
MPARKPAPKIVRKIARKPPSRAASKPAAAPARATAKAAPKAGPDGKPARWATPARAATARAAAPQRPRPVKKVDLPVEDVRRFLEPGPIVLVSSCFEGETDIMTLGWHMVMGFEPSLVGCYIWNANHSFGLIRRSKVCVINVPTVDLAETVVDIGNCSGRDTDKFDRFGLTPQPGVMVSAPLIAECVASFECRLADASLIDRLGLFVFEVVKAHAAPAAIRTAPRTLHYRGDGEFMIAGETTRKWRRRFRPEML